MQSQHSEVGARRIGLVSDQYGPWCETLSQNLKKKIKGKEINCLEP